MDSEDDVIDANDVDSLDDDFYSGEMEEDYYSDGNGDDDPDDDDDGPDYDFMAEAPVDTDESAVGRSQVEAPPRRAKTKRRDSGRGSTSGAQAATPGVQASAVGFTPGVPMSSWDTRVLLRQDDGSYNSVEFPGAHSFQVVYDPSTASHVPVNYYTDLMRATDGIKAGFFANYTTQQDRIDSLREEVTRQAAEIERLGNDRAQAYTERDRLRSQIARSGRGGRERGTSSSSGGRSRHATEVLAGMRNLDTGPSSGGGFDDDDGDDDDDDYDTDIDVSFL